VKFFSSASQTAAQIVNAPNNDLRIPRLHTRSSDTLSNSKIHEFTRFAGLQTVQSRFWGYQNVKRNKQAPNLNLQFT
jgi:hypothetical protein